MCDINRKNPMHDLGDAGAFAMQFVAPPPFNCCQNDRNILKALNKAQADRIKHLEDEIIAHKKQHEADLDFQFNLDEKLDKAAADYRALWVEKEDLKSELASEKEDRRKDQVEAARRYAASENEKNRMERTIRDFEERNKTLRERLANTNESLKRSIQESNKFQADANYLDNLRRCQAKEIKRLHEIVNASNGSCSAYTQQGMQSKIAKQANEIKRLIDDNIHQDEYIETLKKEIKRLTCQNAAQKANASCTLEMWQKYEKEKENLKKALDIAAKDADANFERGHHKGQEELWGVLQDVSEAASMGFNLEPVYGYNNMSDVVANLTASAFLRKTEEDEKHAVKGIGVGDEVEIFDRFCPDDDPHSDIGIVVMIYEPQTDCEPRVYTVIGPKFEAQIDDSDIQSGAVKKTGRRFAYIPLNYFG